MRRGLLSMVVLCGLAAILLVAVSPLPTARADRDEDGNGKGKQRGERRNDDDDEDEDEQEDDEDEVVEKLMEKVHEGKRSPWKKAQKASAAEPVEWATLDEALPRLIAMSDALKVAKKDAVRESSGGYVDAVKQLTEKAKARDADGTREAVKTLKASCADCHYRGGPGGKLD